MSGPESYGRHYWCVKVDKKVSSSGEIYVHADEIRYPDSGAIEFIGAFQSDPQAPDADPTKRLNLVIAPGKWLAAYSASCFDGSAIAVDHWKGEVSR
jgi:hypothetical protein